MSVRPLAANMPEGWRLERLGPLCTKIGSGLTPRGGQKAYVDEGIPLIRSQNVLVGSMDLSDVVYITDEQHAAMSGTYVEPGDVLLNITGASIGRCCTVPMDLTEANVNQHVCIIRPDRRNLLSGFLGFFLNSDEGQQRIWSYQAGGNRQGLNFVQISAFRIPLPPLAEQRRIAEILGTWDEAIALVERRIDAARRRKQGLMQRLLTGRVRFPGFAGDWREVRLRTLVDINYGKSPKDVRSSDGTIPVYGTGGVVDTASESLCDEPAVIIGRKGSIERVYYAEEPCWPIDTTFYATSRGQVDIKWLYHLLVHTDLRRYNEASGVPSLSRSTLGSIKVSLPSMGEQRRIVQVLDTGDDEIDLLGLKLDALQRQKKGLMQRLLAGRVRVAA